MPGAFLIAALAMAAGLPAAASAQGPRWTYTYDDVWCSDAAVVDPINLVFVGASTWPTLDHHWTDHLPEWNWSSNDPSQNALDVNNGCLGMVRERATNSGSDFNWL